MPSPQAPHESSPRARLHEHHPAKSNPAQQGRSDEDITANPDELEPRIGSGNEQSFKNTAVQFQRLSTL